MTDTKELAEQSSETKEVSPSKETKPISTESPKSSPSKKDIDIATQALNHFAQGKRHLLVNDISSAVNSLQEACRLLGEHYGETAPECGDAYFYYGKALLELARIENGVLGNALDGEEGSTEEEESNKDEEESNKDEEESNKDEEESNKDEEESSNQENGDVAEEEGEKTEESEEEDVGNLQLAWEMLELAKLIYTKQLEANPSMNVKIAQVYLKLGEVGLENENYSQSIEDFQQCLDIQTKDLSPDDRCLAETHYQMGVAYSFSDDFDKAIESFGAAASVIENRISNLKKTQEEKATWTEEQKMKDASERKDPFYTEQGEIDELTNLLPEIKERIVDMEQMKKDSKEKLQKIKEATFASVLGGTRTSDGASTSTASGFSDDQGFGFSKPSETAKPTSNISHLIRKKRKPEEEATKEDSKKAKGENGEVTKPTAVNGCDVENKTPSEQ